MRRFTRSRVRIAFLCAGLVAVTALFAAFPMTALQGVQRAAPQGYLGGVVRSSAGPEAGVWVIAETKDLATPLIKIVVTDDQGRYMLPELPDANYSVWVRGYGLADSTPIRSKPVTTQVNLTAVLAKSPQEAAKVYPGNYWMTLMEPPAKSMFPGTGEKADNNPNGNGVGNAMVSQDNWVHAFKSNCNFCHQIGNPLTRTLDHVFKAKPELKTPLEAWDYRLRGGVRGSGMYGSATTMGRTATLKMLVDWTDRIGKGEVPQAPPRPAGIERNVVLTLWDWGTDHSFMHDEITTDKNHPSVNGNGPVYAVSAGHGALVRLDPFTHEATELEIPTRDPKAQVPSRFPAPNPPSLHWGSQHLWANPPYNPADPHNPMMDSKGRVWLTSKIRAQAPAWCADGTKNKSADWFPVRGGGRQASFFDTKTQQFTLIETCYSTHHLQFDTDANETVYFNELSGPLVGWIDSKVYDQTKDEQKAVGWCGQVLDTNGDGKITKPWNTAAGGGRGTTNLYTDGTPGAVAGPMDPAKDTMIAYSLYGVMPSPADNSAWGAAERFPGYLVRVDRGDNPPYTCRAELFKVPSPGLDPRGIDIDKNGVVWTALAASSHLAAFDRRKCKDLKAVAGSVEGTACPEGWTLYESNSPKFKNADIRTDFHYYNWVDRHNIAGFGENVPMATGSNSDSLLVLNTQTRQWTTLRVPYPLGFYSRGMDGRIDDPNTGWKGRALWANYGTHFVWHIEGGKGTKGKMVKFQIRPDPLAR